MSGVILHCEQSVRPISSLTFFYSLSSFLCTPNPPWARYALRKFITVLWLVEFEYLYVEYFHIRIQTPLLFSMVRVEAEMLKMWVGLFFWLYDHFELDAESDLLCYVESVSFGISVCE